MAERWWRVTRWDAKPEMVKVEKATDKTVTIVTDWFGEKKLARRNIECEGERFCRTWTEARDWMISYRQRRHEAAARELTDAVIKLSRAQSLPVEEPGAET